MLPAVAVSWEHSVAGANSRPVAVLAAASGFTWITQLLLSNSY
jgi:hypothetical protein